VLLELLVVISTNENEVVVTGHGLCIGFCEKSQKLQRHYFTGIISTLLIGAGIMNGGFLQQAQKEKEESHGWAIFCSFWQNAGHGEKHINALLLLATVRSQG